MNSPPPRRTRWWSATPPGCSPRRPSRSSPTPRSPNRQPPTDTTPPPPPCGGLSPSWRSTPTGTSAPPTSPVPPGCPCGRCNSPSAVTSAPPRWPICAGSASFGHTTTWCGPILTRRQSRRSPVGGVRQPQQVHRPVPRQLRRAATRDPARLRPGPCLVGDHDPTTIGDVKLLSPVAVPLVALLTLTACGTSSPTAGDPPSSAPPSSPPRPRPPPHRPPWSAPRRPVPVVRSTVAYDRALHDELIAMLQRDQADREGTPQTESDQARTARLKGIISTHGWPTFALVGEDGGNAAWAIAQHSDLDPAFQQQALDLLRSAMADRQASPGNLAYLEDRVAAGRASPRCTGRRSAAARTVPCRRLRSPTSRASSGAGPRPGCPRWPATWPR
ncbi:DUF6624 domain-containing protein [Micromonospora sp. M12]